ncbi:MAG: hypothetical protein ACRD96_15785 [Bryobacteraceae bacterium]
MLIPELSKNDIESTALTECQNNAQAGRFAEAMGAFVQWLAGRYDEALDRFEKLVERRLPGSPLKV